MCSGKKWRSTRLCIGTNTLCLFNAIDSPFQDNIDSLVDSLALWSKNGSYPLMLLNASPYTLEKTIPEHYGWTNRWIT